MTLTLTLTLTQTLTLTLPLPLTLTLTKGPPEDGSSLFYLYCRAERKDLWYPVSVLQSDSQAQGLISAWLNAPLAKGVFKVCASGHS